MSKFDRRDFLKAGAATAAAGVLTAPFVMKAAHAADPIKVGILHSLSGTIAIAEAAIVDAEKMAIDEINAAGGVMGRKIEPIVEDGASDWPTFAEKARKLIQKDKVAAVFGCYTSASRKAVLPVFEQNNGLLYYPTYYEGQEDSKNVIYTAQEATSPLLRPSNGWPPTKARHSFWWDRIIFIRVPATRLPSPLLHAWAARHSARNTLLSDILSSRRSSTRSRRRSRIAYTV